MNIHNILSYRILYNNVRYKEEQQILRDLNEARIRERILSSARAYEVDGENVQADLEQAKSQIADLTKRIPRGDNVSFYIFCILAAIGISSLIYVYRSIHHSIIIDLWGSLDNWYLQEFRYGSTQVYRVGYFIASSIWSPVLAISFLALLWRIQKRLRYSHAQYLIVTIIGLGVIAELIMVGSISELIRPPLGIW